MLVSICMIQNNFILIIYTQLLYLFFVKKAGLMNQQRREETRQTLYITIGLIIIIAIPISISFQLIPLFIISMISLLLLIVKKRRKIQLLFVKFVISLRSNCPFSELSRFGQELQDTKFTQGQLFPTQHDIVYVLMRLKRYQIAQQYIQSLEDKRQYQFAIKFLGYVLENQSSPASSLIKQAQQYLQKFANNLWIYNLYQEDSFSKRKKKIDESLILNLIQFAAGKINRKVLISNKNNIKLSTNNQKTLTQIPNSSSFQLEQIYQNIQKSSKLENDNQIIIESVDRMKKEVVKSILQKNQVKPQKQAKRKIEEGKVDKDEKSAIKEKDTCQSQISIQQRNKQQKQAKQKRQIIQEVQSNRGLANLGNTCYMNSAIQCLHKTFELTTAVKEKKNGSSFIKAYIQLMEQLSKSNRSPFRPSEIKALVSKYYSIFEGYSQQDSSELLSTLLNYINDELNEVTKKAFHNVDKKIKRSDEQLLEEYIKKDHSRSKSVIDDLFVGRFLTVYKCLKCEHQQKLFEKFHIVYLPVPEGKDLSLRGCMEEFAKPDQLRGNNAWQCSKCQKDTPTDKTMHVYQSNRILILCLKRFTETDKINALITFEEQINLKALSSNPQVANRTYDLYGVINHSGRSLHFGHYYSYCKEGESWKEYNDGSVSQIKGNKIVTANAFVLLYRLRE